MQVRDPERPTSGVVTRKLAAPALVLSEHIYGPHTELQRHYHSSSFLTFVLGGMYTEEIGRQRDRCSARMVRYLPAGEPHTNHYLQETRCLYVEVRDSFLAGLNRASVLAAGEVHAPAASSIATRLYRELVVADDLSPVSIEALTTELFVEGCRGKAAHAGPPWLRRVEDALSDRFAERLALSELAAVADVHPTHLCREFHRRHGCSIGEFVRRLRAQRAAELLASSDVPICDIALRVGCSDQSHLCSLFKQRMGMTPSAYRALFHSRQ